MRLPQLTINRLMILVAVVALLIWSTMMVRRSIDYRKRDDRFAALAQNSRDGERSHREIVELYQASLASLDKLQRR